MTTEHRGKSLVTTSQDNLGERVGQLRIRFRDLYSQEPRIFRAPGRVNLIGEHTDYNDGFVMPVAMGLSTWVLAAPRNDSQIFVYSQNVRESVQFDLNTLDFTAKPHWSTYICGVAAALRLSGAEIRGANLLVDGNIPLGAGLSSSASVEVAAGFALLEIAGLSRGPLELAQICQRAENEFAGARCGIMDQMIACCGRANSALLLDCRSLVFELLPLFPRAEFVVCNSMVKHQNAAGEYNARRADCEAATRIFSEHLPAVRALRDVTLQDLDRFAKSLSDVLYRRSRHIVTENLRVTAASHALNQDNPEAFGGEMLASHRSLRDDFEVSCAELDLLVQIATGLKGVYGSRMTGGGFGGCTITLVASEAAAEFEMAIAKKYEQATRRTPETYRVRPSNGVREEFA
jgi:galactokinase